MTKISVVIPTHNRVSLLPRAIKSALNQSFSDIEVIVVSDGSTDGTDEQMKKLSEEDSRIIYISYYPGHNGNYARNTGIKAAKGEYIAFLDDDDEWLPTKLEEQLAVMESDNSIGLVYTGTHSIYVDDGIEYDSFPEMEGNMSRKILLSNFIGSTTTVMVRKKIFEKVGLFDEELPAIQDYDLWIRICQVTPIGVVSKPLVNYFNYRNSGQISSSYKKYEDAHAFVRKKYEKLFMQLSPKELDMILAGQKASFGMRAFRVGNKKIARHYFCESLRIFVQKKVMIYYISTLFSYRFLLKLRSLR